jgi:hypothetical protein
VTGGGREGKGERRSESEPTWIDIDIDRMAGHTREGKGEEQTKGGREGGRRKKSEGGERKGRE